MSGRHRAPVESAGRRRAMLLGAVAALILLALLAVLLIALPEPNDTARTLVH